MRITTKFISSSALLIALTALFSGSSYWVSQRASKMLDTSYQQTQETMAEVVQLELALHAQLTALNRLAALPGNAEELARYERSQTLYFESLETLSDIVPETESLSHVRLDSLRQTHEYVETLANRLTETDEVDISIEDITRSLRLFEIQSGAYIRALADSAQEQAAEYSEQQKAVRARAALLELLSFSAVIVMLLAQFYGLLRPVTKSLARLQAGAERL
ncbi:MAG: hypothetical protein AAFY72_11880 [Cyanobacteria bacterium J06649_4]